MRVWTLRTTCNRCEQEKDLNACAVNQACLRSADRSVLCEMVAFRTSSSTLRSGVRVQGCLRGQKMEDPLPVPSSTQTSSRRSPTTPGTVARMHRDVVVEKETEPEGTELALVWGPEL